MNIKFRKATDLRW